MSFDDLVLLLPVRRIAFQRRIAVFDRHPLVEVDGFQVGGLSCGALLLDSIGERDVIGKGATVAHLSQPTPTLIDYRPRGHILGTLGHKPGESHRNTLTARNAARGTRWMALLVSEGRMEDGS